MSKKSKYLFLLACLLMLGGCLRIQTWDPYTGPGGDDEDTPGDSVAVELQSYMPYTLVNVKSAGALDNWDGKQELYIYGIAREGLNAAADLSAPLDLTQSGILINNVKAFKTPAADPDPAHPTPQLIEIYYREDTTPMERFYYDEDRRYEFFGYYVDDAADPASAQVGTSAITLPVTINGSQDLMLATADKTEDNKTVGINTNRMYSAYSARKGIRPTLQFKHQLARFDVRVQSGDFKSQKDLAAKLTLAGVKVDSKNKGTLYIANKDYATALPYLKADDTSSAPLDIWRWKDGALAPLTIDDEFKLVKTDGEGHMTAPLLSAGTVMVMPGEKQYGINVSLAQEGYSLGLVDYNALIDFSNVKPADGLVADTVAVAGHQYYIDVVVYGLQGIDILVSMTQWQEAGTFLIDKDREVEITLNTTNMDFYATTDAPIQIEATTVPAEAAAQITYTSMNDAVATVSATGLVTPTGLGTTHIYVTAPSVGDYYASQRLVTVTVLPYASIDVLPEKTLAVNDTWQINVEQPDGQGAAITYRSLNEGVATVDNHGLVTARSAGNATIQVTAAAIPGKCREKTVDIALTVNN